MAKGRRPIALRRQIIGNLRRRTINISQPIRVVTVRYRGIPPHTLFVAPSVYVLLAADDSKKGVTEEAGPISPAE